MKKLFSLLFLLAFALSGNYAKAQDIIVLRDGSLIESKVMEITPNELKYKKFSNMNGPLYTILKEQVLAVNYENGEKESFANVTSQTAPVAANTPTADSAPQEIEVPADEKNAKLLEKYNKTVGIVGNPEVKKKEQYNCVTVYHFTKSSIISNKDIEVNFVLDHYYRYCCQYSIEIENKSDKIIYIDLANTFHGNDTYYNGSEQLTVSSGSSSGGSVNLGSVANALDVGGVVGTLAGGMSVGGGKSNQVSTTYTNQRFIAIPPRGERKLSEHKEVVTQSETLLTMEKKQATSHGENFIDIIGYMKDRVRVNEVKTYNEENTPLTRNYHITYSSDANFKTYSTLKFAVYLHQAIGVKYGWGVLKKLTNYEGVIKGKD